MCVTEVVCFVLPWMLHFCPLLADAGLGGGNNTFPLCPSQLLRRGGNPNVGSHPCPVLLTAVQSSDAAMVELLLEHDADANGALRYGALQCNMPCWSVCANQIVWGTPEQLSGQPRFWGWRKRVGWGKKRGGGGGRGGILVVLNSPRRLVQRRIATKPGHLGGGVAACA